MINSDGKLGPVRGSATVARISSGAESAPAKAKVAASTASQSSSLKIISVAQEIARQAPPIDAVRVAQLRRAISEGDYPVDTLSIAQALISRATGAVAR
jgi:flagellar biosynthesis anti-sigma factor FlgM